MKESKKITMWIQWSDEDAAFIGYRPQFFPYGAVCHAHTEAKAVAKLVDIVRDELDEQSRQRIPRGRRTEEDVMKRPRFDWKLN